MIVSAKETKEKEVVVGADTGKRAGNIISQMAAEGYARNGQVKKNTGYRGRG